MSYWCEIHCDTPVHLTPQIVDRRCDHETGAIPALSLTNIRKALDGVASLARERGYRWDKSYGWQCPNCQKSRRYE